MIRLLSAATLALGATALLPAPAYAAGVDCQVSGSDVTITVPSGGTVWLGQTEQGDISVALDQTSAVDCGPSGDMHLSLVTSPAGGGTTWIVDTAVPWNATITITDAASDTLEVDGYESPDYWVAPASPAVDLQLDVNGAGVLTLTTPPAQTRLLPGDGDDQVDLTSWTSTTTTVDPGAGADGVVGSAGADTVLLTPDEAPDSVDGAGGVDSLVFDAQEPVTYDADRTVDDGAAGEGDDLWNFESVTGGSANDRLVAGDLPSVLHGGPGNDVLVGGPGSDTLTGDAGLDTISFEAYGAVTVDATLATGQGIDTLGDGHTERVVGSAYADHFHLTDPTAVVQPGNGNDTVVADVAGTRLVSNATPDGADTFSAPSGAGTWDYSLRTTKVRLTADADGSVDGSVGEHDDVATHGAIGGRADDILVGTNLADTLDGAGGKDSVAGREGPDVVRGGAGNDLVNGGGGDDQLDGGTGADTMIGGLGADVLRGGDGDDVVDGGYGTDTVYGDAGNDRFDERETANGADSLHGGKGLDSANYSQRAKKLKLADNGKATSGERGEGDTIGPDVEWLRGGHGADTLYGNQSADRLEGGDGNDVLKGRNGSDLLLGGTGRDLMVGGAGNDRLNSRDKDADDVQGGTGRDRARVDKLDRVRQVEGTF